MKVVFFILLILFLLLVLLLFAPSVRVMMVVSERTKSAYYSVAHKLLNLTRGKVVLLEDGSISIVDKKSVLLKKRLPKELVKILAMNLIEKIKITNFEVYLSGGKKDNPFLTAMASGYARVVLGALSAISNNHNVDTSVDSKADFKDTNFTIAISSKIKISVLNLVIVLIKSNKNYKKQQKKEKKYAKV